MTIVGSPGDWAAFVWFLALWGGYTAYAMRAAETRACLASQLYFFRRVWVAQWVQRENRITDITILNSLTHMGNFLASTSMLIIAGAITALYSAKSIVVLLSDHQFVSAPTVEQVQFKLLFLIFIFVFSFFRLTWSMRQHTFLALMLGAAPVIPAGEAAKAEATIYIDSIADISQRASNQFNYGLRAFYFALAFMAWFVGPVFFMLSSALVTYVLYQREFRSSTLKHLTRARTFMQKPSVADMPPAPVSHPANDIRLAAK